MPTYSVVLPAIPIVNNCKLAIFERFLEDLGEKWKIFGRCVILPQDCSLMPKEMSTIPKENCRFPIQINCKDGIFDRFLVDFC